MNPNNARWEKGDFTRIAATTRESGEALVAALGVTAGLKVLDLECGDGTTALPAARRGADVNGVDIARNLVEAGNRRAQQEGLTNTLLTTSALRPAQKSNCTLNFAKRAVMIDVGISHDPPAMSDWL
jgi:cyclopropane fatty-acyl-phospholipid synthase-like methyltransferase